MSHTLRYQISAALLEALQEATALAGAVVMDNPVTAAALAKGDRIVFLEDLSDGFIDQANQQGKRRFVFGVGAICRKAAARAGADADYAAAEAAVRAAHTTLMSTLRCGPLRERDVVFKAEGLDVGGALVLGTFEVEYLKPRPA